LLRIYILNVGHGDSIVLEFHNADEPTSFAVIDSNCSPDSRPPALDLLISLGATNLSFVSITHPHADHYMGIRAILEHFSGRIDTLYTFPIRREREDLKKLIRAYKSFATSTDDRAQQKRLIELARILLLAGTAVRDWEDPTGTRTVVTARGFSAVRISTLLPPARVKGNFFQQIINGTIEPERPALNDLSMAFVIEYAGHQIILGGDGTRKNWIYQANKWKANMQEFAASAVKIPHHGSKEDCKSDVLNILFGDKDAQIPNAVACISANGRTHPSSEVLNEIVSRGILPYCTNLAKRCGGYLTHEIKAEHTDPVLVRFVNSAATETNGTTQPCQGNIILEFAPGQPIKVKTQHANLCPLRGELDFLSGAMVH
jgi:beta-lactamase superfamily II metal-dependent hydrolase